MAILQIHNIRNIPPVYYMNPENKRYRYVNQASIMANPNGYEYVLPLDSEGAIDVTKDIYSTGIYNQSGENRGYRNKYDPKTTYFAVDDNGRVINDFSVPHVINGNNMVMEPATYGYFPLLGGYILLPLLDQLYDKDLLDDLDKYSDLGYLSTAGLSNVAQIPDLVKATYLKILLNYGQDAASKWADSYFKQIRASNAGMAGIGAGMATYTMMPTTVGDALLYTPALLANMTTDQKKKYIELWSTVSLEQLNAELDRLYNQLVQNGYLLQNGVWKEKDDNSGTFPVGTVTTGTLKALGKNEKIRRFTSKLTDWIKNNASKMPGKLGKIAKAVITEPLTYGIAVDLVNNYPWLKEKLLESDLGKQILGDLEEIENDPDTLIEKYNDLISLGAQSFGERENKAVPRYFIDNNQWQVVTRNDTKTDTIPPNAPHVSLKYKQRLDAIAAAKDNYILLDELQTSLLGTSQELIPDLNVQNVDTNDINMQIYQYFRQQ